MDIDHDFMGVASQAPFAPGIAVPGDDDDPGVTSSPRTAPPSRSRAGWMRWCQKQIRILEDPSVVKTTFELILLGFGDV